MVSPRSDAAVRRAAGAHLPRRQLRVPGLVRAGPGAGAHRQVADRARGRDPRLVAGDRLPDRGPVLDGPGDRARRAAGRGGVRGAVDTVRGSRAAAAAAPAVLAARAGRPGGGAQLLAAHRMAALLAGTRRPVGRVRRQPVAASRHARARLRRRGLARQLRARARQRGHRPRAGVAAAGRRRRPARGSAAIGPGRPRRGRRPGQHRRRAAGLCAHPAQSPPSGRSPSPWCSPA